MRFKSVNKLFTVIIYYKLLLKHLHTKHILTTSFRSVDENVCVEGGSSGCKSSYEPVLHSYMWISYSLHNTWLGIKYNEVVFAPDIFIVA
jgi:hypothetical protein